jgi:CO/xanthine dehydrogenase Mo-binding subunit
LRPGAAAGVGRGVAQGIGQALLECGHYDDASGQLVAGSFMDYTMPRAVRCLFECHAAHDKDCVNDFATAKL